MKKIVTHSGSFHPDDCFAVAVILMSLGDEVDSAEIEIIRSREPEVVKTGDFVVDVGAVYAPDRNLFDHHQSGGAGERNDGVPYASFGLVWKKFGEGICGSRAVAEEVDRTVVAPIDYCDNNGCALSEIYPGLYPYTIERMISVFNEFSAGEEGGARDTDSVFKDMVSLAGKILEREIIFAKTMEETRPAIVNAYNKAEDKRIVVLDIDSPWFFALSGFSEPLFVVQPDSKSGNWCVTAVRKGQYVFENKRDLPQAWAGLRDEKLAKVSGVSDAVFCHNKLFMAVAKTREGAIALAVRALQV